MHKNAWLLTESVCVLNSELGSTASVLETFDLTNFALPSQTLRAIGKRL